MKRDPAAIAHGLETRIGHVFSRVEWLELALRHSSYVHEHGMRHTDCNERLEFLGDAVLEMISSRFLFERYPDKREGELTVERASLVCEKALAQDAERLGLGAYLMLGKGEEKMGGRSKQSMLADAMEALIGALYLDGGIEAAEAFILRFVLSGDAQRSSFTDKKTELQELLQAKDGPVIRYHTEAVSDRPDENGFVSAVFIGGEECGRGKGASKKAAEQEAAGEALEKLRAGRRKIH